MHVDFVARALAAGRDPKPNEGRLQEGRRKFDGCGPRTLRAKRGIHTPPMGLWDARRPRLQAAVDAGGRAGTAGRLSRDVPRLYSRCRLRVGSGIVPASGESRCPLEAPESREIWTADEINCIFIYVLAFGRHLSLGGAARGTSAAGSGLLRPELAPRWWPSL